MSAAEGPIRVVIVEDKQRIREGLEALVSGSSGLQCAGAYDRCESMLAELPHDRPDVALMDIGLPGMSGIEGIRRARTIAPDLSALVLSVHEDADHIFDALCAGASGYLVKNTPPAQLVAAIRDAHGGGAPMSSHIARRVVSFFRQALPPRNASEAPLTPRETEILGRLAEGDAYKQVGDRLNISVDTVRYHIRNIYRKLEVHSQSAAVSKAIRRGLI